MLVHRRVTPSIKFAGTHLYTWVERGTVRVKYLAQEDNTMSPAKARTRNARSRDKRTNREATAPPRKCLVHIGNPITSHHKTEFDNVKSDRHRTKHFLITLIRWMEKGKTL